MRESRTTKSFKNARINLIFYFISLALAFFSRKIFLDSLGDDFMGLVGTLQDVLGFLNLAELGVSTAIGYVLYKPLFEQDRLKINEVISIFGYLYRKIGIIILSLGCILALFLPLIFYKSGFPISGIFFAFFVFLASTLFSYFINYKQTLLSADQRNYVITMHFQSANILKTLFQMMVALYTSNYYYWIVIDLIFSIVYSIILNMRIKKIYPWLNSNIKSGKQFLHLYPEVIIYTKQLFIHRIASFVQSQTASILIYAFVSLKTVAFYGNYMLIVSKLSLLMNNVMEGTNAGIGNLIAEGDKPNIKQVYRELLAFRYFVGGVLVFSVYGLMEPFISLWVGQEYVLNRSVLILILINTYISQTRNINDMFLVGYGLFSDIWAPFAEALISIFVAIAGGYYFGLEGILVGPIVSLFLIVGIWKPYFLFKKGFQSSLRFYWFSVFKFLTILFISWQISCFILSLLHDFVNPGLSYFSWIRYAVLVVGIFGLVEFMLMFAFDYGMRSFFFRIKCRIIKKFKE